MSISWLWYPPNVFWALVGIFAILSGATVLVAIAQCANPSRDLRELWLRIKTWWIIIAVLSLALGSVQAWQTAPYVLFGFISFIALKEFLSIVPTRRVDRPVFIIAY